MTTESIRCPQCMAANNERDEHEEALALIRNGTWPVTRAPAPFSNALG